MNKFLSAPTILNECLKALAKNKEAILVVAYVYLDEDGGSVVQKYDIKNLTYEKIRKIAFENNALIQKDLETCNYCIVA